MQRLAKVVLLICPDLRNLLVCMDTERFAKCIYRFVEQADNLSTHTSFGLSVQGNS